MAKSKAPEWLRLAFCDGVDEAQLGIIDQPGLLLHPKRACILAQYDQLGRDCTYHTLERFHWINRQRVENAFAALLPTAIVDIGGQEKKVREELILLAAWDPRNGGIACEGHHRRLDSHLTPALVIPRAALPEHVEEFAADWGLESELEKRFR